jgi:uncharacterized protein with PIN domain
MRPLFLADEMLGSLARWLRIMGYDTGYARDMTDREVLVLAHAEERTILTRDRQLAARAGADGLYIISEVLEEQLSQVAAAFRLDFHGGMTRCTLCNGVLTAQTQEQVRGRVPPRVLASHEKFYVCVRCGQVYWKGSHWVDIAVRLEGVLGPRSDNSPR